MDKLIILLPLLLLFSCKEDNSRRSPDDLLQQMERINGQIEALLETSCPGGDQCVATPIGVKPCGGPARFIVHSNATDQEKLDELISAYNELNTEYNEVTNAFSDCVIVNPPEVGCLSGKCEVVSS